MENPREVQRRTKKKEDPCWPVHGPRFLQMDISPLCGGHLCWVGVPLPQCLHHTDMSAMQKHVNPDAHYKVLNMQAQLYHESSTSVFGYHMAHPYLLPDCMCYPL